MVRKITYFVMAMIASTAWTLSSASAMDLNGEIKTISETKRTEIKKKIESIAAKSEEKILELKEKTENKTNEMRTKACEARQTNMQTRLDNRVTAADRHKEKFDAIYKKISDFASSKSLSSSDISSLANIVDAAGLNATDEIPVIIILVLIGLLVFAGLRVSKKNTTEKSTPTEQSVIAEKPITNSNDIQTSTQDLDSIDVDAELDTAELDIDIKAVL